MVKNNWWILYIGIPSAHEKMVLMKSEMGRKTSFEKEIDEK
jgi:hypothetical protein